MNAFLLVASGGALGSVARHGLNMIVARHFAGLFPLGILLVNVFGCFLMGVLAAALLRVPVEHENARLFLATGFLGGFTTFSAFALDTMRLVQAGQTLTAAGYVVLSVLASILAAFAGFALVRALA